jgi:hypothetical protein
MNKNYINSLTTKIFDRISRNYILTVFNKLLVLINEV